MAEYKLFLSGFCGSSYEHGIGILSCKLGWPKEKNPMLLFRIMHRYRNAHTYDNDTHRQLSIHCSVQSRWSKFKKTPGHLLSRNEYWQQCEQIQPGAVKLVLWRHRLSHLTCIQCYCDIREPISLHQAAWRLLAVDRFSGQFGRNLKPVKACSSEVQILTDEELSPLSAF